MRDQPVVSVVDLFCGAGGLTYGLKKEGLKVRAGVDLDPACRFAYERNNGASYLLRDIRTVRGSQLSRYLKGADYTLLAGCAPCQPFSKYTQGRDASADGKWGLLNQFSRLVEETSPDFVTMENVPNLVRHGVFTDFRNQLRDQGYQVVASVVRCADYGIPQTRERLVLIASRYAERLALVNPNRYKKATVRDTISHLPSIAAGGIDANDELHRASSISQINRLRLRASKPGGSWKDWPEALRAKCHKRESGGGYVGVYGRMEWDAPAPTMTTQCFGFGNGRFGHPEQERAISLREAALIQSFPENYQFEPEGVDLGMKALGRMIGNAVPVKLGVVIARSFKQHIRLIERA